jgi:hypothetical protein
LLAAAARGKPPFRFVSYWDTKGRFPCAAVRAVGEGLGSWPIHRIKRLKALPADEEKRLIALLKTLPARDRQVFHLQQRAIGEMLIVDKDAGPVCLRSNDFLAKWEDATFAAWLGPLRDFLEGLEPGTRRWMRLELVRGALAALDRECRRVLAPWEKAAC